MENDTRRLYCIKIGILTSVLYIISTILYMKFYYKPLEIIAMTGNADADSIVSEANVTIRSMNHDDLKTFFIVALGICLIISIITLIIYEEIVLYRKPIITVNARLKSKKGVTKMSGEPKNGYYLSNAYYLSFQIENGTEIKFTVTPKQYMFVCEGNKGVLKYKQGAFKRFVGFDIKEIS